MAESGRSRGKPSRLIVVDGFYPEAGELRIFFEKLMGDPRGTDPRRFCWDLWSVPNQYRLLRTPAYLFFSKQIYEPFHQRLALWGREMLGCHDISPPWLSAYVDGCEQQFHADLPHGPWAFVYSLTPWKKTSSGAPPFKGGETLLLREEILQFWEQQKLGDEAGLEQAHVLERIPPFFDRLTVFDPRIPHGVSRVQGPQSVLEARLVIHGWFVNPRPFIQGRLKERALASAIDRLLSSLDRLLQAPQWSGARLQGMLSLRFEVGELGQVVSPTVLVSSLRSQARWPQLPGRVASHLVGTLSEINFGAAARDSRVTLPILFG